MNQAVFHQFGSRGLRPRIEEMIARGFSIRKTATATGASVRYVEDLASHLHAHNRLPIVVCRERDAKHYATVLAHGGFKALPFTRSDTVYERVNGEWRKVSL